MLHSSAFLFRPTLRWRYSIVKTWYMLSSGSILVNQLVKKLQHGFPGAVSGFFIISHTL